MKPADLKQWRAARAMTQARLAAILGVTDRAIRMWESGARKIPPYLWLALRAIDDYLEV